MTKFRAAAAKELAKQVDDLLGFLAQYPHQYAADISGYVNATQRALDTWNKARKAPKGTLAKQPLWTFRWKEGGYNQVFADTRTEALLRAESQFPTTRLTLDRRSLTALRTEEEQAKYWRQFPRTD